MTRLPEREDTRHEFKAEWTDKALEDLAAFANADGGTLYLGVQDDGDIGARNPLSAEGLIKGSKGSLSHHWES